MNTRLHLMYAEQSIAENINGYFLPSPTKPGGDVAEFERAKAEYLSVQRFRMELAESLTFERFTLCCKYQAAERAAGL